jgi:hypothetical protein
VRWRSAVQPSVRVRMSAGSAAVISVMAFMGVPR